MRIRRIEEERVRDEHNVVWDSFWELIVLIIMSMKYVGLTVRDKAPYRAPWKPIVSICDTKSLTNKKQSGQKLTEFGFADMERAKLDDVMFDDWFKFIKRTDYVTTDNIRYAMGFPQRSM